MPTIPQQVHNMLLQVANKTTLKQNNWQLSWFQGTSRVNVFEDDTFYCADAQSTEWSKIMYTHFDMKNITL
jgi:ribosomal protein S4E